MSDRTPYAERQDRFGRLFDSPLGRRVLQEILEAGGVFEAPDDLAGDALHIAHGARALALDIAMLAGLLPEVPGSGGRDVPDQPAIALAGEAPPGGDDSEEADF